MKSLSLNVQKLATNKQADRTKIICPDHSIWGHNKKQSRIFHEIILAISQNSQNKLDGHFISDGTFTTQSSMLSCCNGTPTTPTSARNGSVKKRKRDENSPDGGDSNRKRWRKTSPTAAEYATMSVGSDFPLQKLVSITYRISGIFRWVRNLPEIAKNSHSEK